jgi:hypothetical protein
MKQPAAAALNDTDISYLLLVSRLQYVSTEQVARRFPQSLRTVQRRLAALAERQYLRRVPYPRTTESGAVQRIYQLDTKGKIIVVEAGGEVEHRVRKAAGDDPTPWFLAHTLTVGDICILTELAEEQLPDVWLRRLIHEHQLKQMPVSVTLADGTQDTVIPDLFITLSVGRNRWSLIFEVDRGTISQKRWKERIASYLAFKDEPYEAAFGEDAYTFCVPTSAGVQRLGNLLHWTWDVLRAAGEEETAANYRFTASDPATTPPGDFFFAPVWGQPGQAAPVPLIERIME